VQPKIEGGVRRLCSLKNYKGIIANMRNADNVRVERRANASDRRSWQMPVLSRFLNIANTLYSVSKTLIFWSVIIIVLYAIFSKIGENRTILQIVNVPPSLSKHGYTKEVVALQLRDEVYRIINKPLAFAKSNKPTNNSNLHANMEDPVDTMEIDAPLINGDPVVLPGTRFTVRSIVDFIKDSFSIKDLNIQGEIIEVGNQQYKMRIRVLGLTSGDEIITLSEDMKIEELIVKAGFELTKVVFPYILARNYFYDGKLEEAKRISEDMIKNSHSEKKWAYLIIGNLDLKDKQYEDAMDNYNTAIKLDGNFALAYSNLGVVYYRQAITQKKSHEINLATKNVNRARRNFEKAVNTGGSQAKFFLGASFEYAAGITELRDCEQALKWYKESADEGNILAKPAFDRLSNKASCASK